MARQGRQPQQLSADTKSNKSKPNKKKSSKGKAKVPLDSANLDVYSFTSSTKRPRGDVDPAARASFKENKAKGKGKGKGKARQEEDEGEEDEDVSDGDSEVESESETEGFKVRGNDIIDFTGLKPAGLKMGMGSDEEGGFGSDDDEDINSDFSDEMSDEAPKKKKASSSKVS